MSSDWEHLQSLFHTALALKVEERGEYLERACVGKEELRRELASLIEASEKRADFLEEPAWNIGMQVIASDATDDLTNQSIGTFKILDRLGTGGMGNVYLAEDTQLGRKVALKFLSGKLADNPWAKRQFVKEAQAVAMLDHPNICPVYGFDEADGYSFIIMQFVDGERLDQLIERKKPELHEIASLAVQIASALAEAHVHSIIHRDIKPPNIMVTAGGQVKVLDFGLAKLIQQQGLQSADDLSSNSLQLGFIPGTVGFMSPEQLRGEQLDYRTDIFSFGVVLFELVCGKNPFARDNKAETISAILTSQPPSLRDNARHVPRELDRIVQKCLEKDRNKRYQSASELLGDLEIFQRTIVKDPPKPTHVIFQGAAATASLLLLMTVATFVYGYLTRPHAIAILPIVNETGDAGLDYMGDGLTEGVINKLSGLTKLRVKAFSMVAHYKGRPLDPRKSGGELDVDAVVVGKLTGTRDALLLHTSIINTADGSQLWGGEYPIKVERLLQVEDDVSREVISRLELWPRKDEARVGEKPRPRNPEAREQFMLGRYYWRFRNKENIEKAIKHYEAAIQLDPLYAQAYAGLAECYLLRNTVLYGKMKTKDAMTMAEAAAREALEIDANLPEAHTSLGTVQWKWHLNWSEAEREFKRAIDIDPEFAPAHAAYSVLLSINARHREATEESEIAKNLDPFSPAMNLFYCRTFYFARDTQQAAACFENLVNVQPDYKNHQYMLGLVYLEREMLQEATEIFEKLYATDKALAGATLGYAYGMSGRREDALSVLTDMKALQADDTYIPPQEFAIIYVGLGEKDKAFELLNQAAAERFAPLAFANVEPLFDSLRSDARFAALTRSINLPSPPID